MERCDPPARALPVGARRRVGPGGDRRPGLFESEARGRRSPTCACTWTWGGPSSTRTAPRCRQASAPDGPEGRPRDSRGLRPPYDQRQQLTRGRDAEGPPLLASACRGLWPPPAETRPARGSPGGAAVLGVLPLDSDWVPPGGDLRVSSVDVGDDTQTEPSAAAALRTRLLRAILHRNLTAPPWGAESPSSGSTCAGTGSRWP